MRFAVILIVVACGGAKPAPPKPKPLDAKGLAKLLDEDLAKLGEIAHRLRGNCTATIEELGAHVDRMKGHELEVKRMLDDAQEAANLKQELAAYASRATGKSDAIAQDLGVTYLACGKLCPSSCRPAAPAPPRGSGGAKPEQPKPDPEAGCATPVCRERYQLERLIASMPTY